jgi:Pentapeptide repeats (8 copies)
MANQEHLAILKQGVDIWNTWREQFPDIRPDLRKADLRNANLSEADLSRADLGEADLGGAYLRGAYLIFSDLIGADLTGAFLIGTNLSGAGLNKANLNKTLMVDTDLTGATLINCRVYGTSIWNVKLEKARQENLIITPHQVATITVDALEVAQFIYLLLSNKKIRDVIDSITSKAVLILGRFTAERKPVLDALRDELRKQNYIPVLFDFEKPASRDLTETVRTLAHLARFIIADLTDPSSIPQELLAIVPDLEVPVQPLLLEAKREYSMFVDFRKYHWVLPIYLYKDQASLIASLHNEIIEPAEKKTRELTIEKAKRLERP